MPRAPNIGGLHPFRNSSATLPQPLGGIISVREASFSRGVRSEKVWPCVSVEIFRDEIVESTE